MEFDKDKPQDPLAKPVPGKSPEDDVTGEYDPGQLNPFFKSDDKLAEASLNEDRQKDLTNLAAIVGEPGENFYKNILEVDGAQAAQDPDKQRQFKAISEFFSEPKDGFYAPSGLTLDESDKDTLTADQRVLLETVSRLSDNESFRESNPVLSDTRSLPPRQQLAPALDAIPTPSPKPAAPPVPDTEMTAKGLEGAGVISTMTYGQLSELKGEKETTDLLSRTGGTHVPGYVDKDSLRRRSQPLSFEAKLAISLVALAVPLFGFAVYNQTQANAQVDKVQQQETFAMAEESVESKSSASKMDQPFRMPAGRTGPLGGGGGAGGSVSNNKSASGEGGMEWHPPATTGPAPTADQLAEGSRAIQAAENMQALGKSGQAAIVLSAALGQCPGNVQLRVATIRCYMAMGEYRTARLICQEGMKNARSFGDFSILQALLAQIPNQ